MQQDIVRELFAIADEQIVTHAADRTTFAPVWDDQMPVRLLLVAKEVRYVKSMADNEILPTFFSPEACTLLKTMPNRYWFWHIVKETLVRTPRDSNNQPIEASAVQQAISATRRDKQVPLGLYSSANPTPGEWLMRMSLGFVLVKFEGGVPVPVPNPIFERESN